MNIRSSILVILLLPTVTNAFLWGLFGLPSPGEIDELEDRVTALENDDGGGDGDVMFDDGSSSIGTEAEVDGVLVRNEVGLRLLEPAMMARRNRNRRQLEDAIPALGGLNLLFGPTNDCRIQVKPDELSGIIVRDPKGLRVFFDETGPNMAMFGPTEDCTIGIDPELPGLLLRDPRGVRLINPRPDGGPIRLLFGPTDECRIDVDPTAAVATGIRLTDPFGVRIVGFQPGDQPPDDNTPLFHRLNFGNTNDCSIRAGLIRELIPSGLIFTDPNGFLFEGGNANFQGSIFAQNLATGSSRKLKKDIRTISNAKDIIQSLRGVHFKWKETEQADVGFIAEEVAEVLPEVAVMDDETNQPKGVKYANVVAVVVEALKEAQNEIDNLHISMQVNQDHADELRELIYFQQEQIDILKEQMMNGNVIQNVAAMG